MSIAEHITKAADLIETGGWWAGESDLTSPLAPGHCVISALAVVSSHGASAMVASKDLIKDHLCVENIVHWNDAPGRTAEEVIEMMRDVAQIAADKGI